MTRLQKRFRARSGYTLIHCMVVIAMLPVIIIAATTWVHESLKMSSRFEHRRETHVALNHLANQIRNDVHSCKTLELNKDQNQINLNGYGDQQVVFEIDQGDVQKTVTVGGEVVARERYRISDEYFIEWDAAVTEDNPNRLAINVFRYPTAYRRSAPKSLDVPDPKLELVITAQADRWKRSVSFGRNSAKGTEE